MIKSQDLCDYEPHCYTDEGQCDLLSDLDTISIMEPELQLHDLEDLDSRFKNLAALSRPDLIS